jgi:hypothetical protein
MAYLGNMLTNNGGDVTAELGFHFRSATTTIRWYRDQRTSFRIYSKPLSVLA